MIFVTMKNEPMIKIIYQYGPSARTGWRIAPLPVAAQYGIYLITISLPYCDFGMINKKEHKQEKSNFKLFSKFYYFDDGCLFLTMVTQKKVHFKSKDPIS